MAPNTAEHVTYRGHRCLAPSDSALAAAPGGPRDSDEKLVAHLAAAVGEIRRRGGGAVERLPEDGHQPEDVPERIVQRDGRQSHHVGRARLAVPDVALQIERRSGRSRGETGGDIYSSCGAL